VDENFTAPEASVQTVTVTGTTRVLVSDMVISLDHGLAAPPACCVGPSRC
jgi:hypothetical protein